MNMQWNALKFRELRFGGEEDCSEGLLFTPGHYQVLVSEEVIIENKLSVK